MIQSTIEVRGLSVEVTRKRMRYIRVRIKRDGSVCLSVPWHVTTKDAVDFLASKWDWVEQTRAKALSRPAPESPLYRDGDNVLLFGESLRLEIVNVPYGGNIVELRDGAIRLYQACETTADQRARLIETFRVVRLRKCLTSLLDEWLTRLGEGPVKWSIRDMSTEWGSCTKARRTLRFGRQLAQVPLPCVEYVVVHELTHLRVPNHGPDFKALMDERLPDWHMRRRTLNAAPVVPAGF